MSEDTLLPFDFPAVGRKKVVAAFDGGRLTSDGGVMLLAVAERRLGIADKLAALIADPRDSDLVTHRVADILRAHIFAIACGYEDGNDLDRLRGDPGFKLACGRLPDSGRDLCSQPTVSRWENAPTRHEVAAMSYAPLSRCKGIAASAWDRYLLHQLRSSTACGDAGYRRHRRCRAWRAAAVAVQHPPRRTLLPADPCLRHRNRSLGRGAAAIRQTPSGREVRGHIRRLVRRIRTHWPRTRLTIRGDSHYGRFEAMAWCEANGVDYIFGLGGNDVLDRLGDAAADDVRVRYAEGDAPVVRRYGETRYGAKSWKCERRVSARIEASCNGLDIRYVVTNIARGSAEWLYDTLYCERGQAENLIKSRSQFAIRRHKSQLASDRTNCHSPLANQVHLLLYTAAYWLMLALRDAIPKPRPLASAEFTTLRLHLIKVAARVIETATRVGIAFTASCPEAGLFGSIAR
jgi:hypothetical protein